MAVVRSNRTRPPPLFEEAQLQVEKSVLKGRTFTGCGKTRLAHALCQGTTSVVPISCLFLSFQAAFSPRQIFDFPASEAPGPAHISVASPIFPQRALLPYIFL